jgi:hypothetical protein
MASKQPSRCKTDRRTDSAALFGLDKRFEEHHKMWRKFSTRSIMLGVGRLVLVGAYLERSPSYIIACQGMRRRRW